MRRYVFRLAILSLAVLVPAAARANDQEIAQQIVQQLQAEKQAGGLKGFSIDLSVEEGTVWLSGRVANPDQQAKALDIARRIPGVKQVVNDLSVAPPPATPRSVFSNMTSAVSKVMGRQVQRPDDELQPVAAEEVGPIGSGVAHAVGPQPVQVAEQGDDSSYYAQPAATPVYAGSRNQVPLAFAPARQTAHTAVPFHRHHGGAQVVPGDVMPGNIVGGGGPVPMHLPGSGIGIAPATYDHPHMPGYAWPSYAAYPNYAGVTYPRQYSPTAWPYIGPFYPYPQVPLGWRKVTLEWDDGWWMLDFKDRRTMYNH
jgi:hypothetical protein